MLPAAHGQSTDDGSVVMPERPFVVLGIQQVAIGAADKRSLTRLWVEFLGLPPVGSYRSATENVDEDIVSFGTGRQHCEIDLMQPVDPKAKPRVDEPPLNHIGLWVDDLAAAYAWLSARGVRFAAGGIRTGAAGHDVCFVHPKGDLKSPVGGEGVLIELVQAPAAVVDALGGGPE
jgi:lactoylglutathione lyase